MYLEYLEWPSNNRFWPIFTYFSLIIVVLGLVGNILLFITYCQPNLRKLPISLYGRVMSANNVYITIHWIRIFSLFEYNYDWNSQSNFLCKILVFTICIAGPISAWCHAAASITTFITIVYPARFKIIGRAYFPVLVVSGIVCFNVLFYFHNLFDVYIVEIPVGNQTNATTKLVCTFSAAGITTIVDLLNTSLLPFIVMITFSILTFMGVLSSRKRVQKHSLVGGSASKMSRIQCRDMRFGITMITINVVFVLTNAPIMFLSVIMFHFNVDVDQDVSRILWFLFFFLFYSFYAIPFYVKLTVNSLVRKEFLKFSRQLTSKSTQTEKNI